MSDSHTDPTRYVVLGEPLDQMLNADCKYPFQLRRTDCPQFGGLVLPSASDPGTGNIVICGKAGSGKSTLALQILAEAVRRNDGIHAAYISLEEDQAQICRKAQNYGWSPYVWPLNRPFAAQSRPSVQQMGVDLAEILQEPMLCHATGRLPRSADRGQSCPTTSDDRMCPYFQRCQSAAQDESVSRSAEFTPFPGKVILPQIEPKAFSPEGPATGPDALFWTRYHQIDSLLQAARRVSEGQPTGRTKALSVPLHRTLQMLTATARQAGAILLSLLGKHGKMANGTRDMAIARAVADVAASYCPFSSIRSPLDTTAFRQRLEDASLMPCRPPDGTAPNAVADAILVIVDVCCFLLGASQNLNGIATRLTHLERSDSTQRMGGVSIVKDDQREEILGLPARLKKGTGEGSEVKSPYVDMILELLDIIGRSPCDGEDGADLALVDALGHLRRKLEEHCELEIVATEEVVVLRRMLREMKGFLLEKVPIIEGDSIEPLDRLQIVCIDSLNVLGSDGLTRDHLAALFDLFRRRQTIGVFIVEENDKGVFAGDTQIDGDTVDFLADMVIELTTAEEYGYFVRHFQIQKSRYQKHVLGKHPFKINGIMSPPVGKLPWWPSVPMEYFSPGKRPFVASSEEAIGLEFHRRSKRVTGLRIFPSLHTIVSASDHLAEEDGVASQTRGANSDSEGREPPEGLPRYWSLPSLDGMVRVDRERVPVFAVSGPDTAGKSLIAGNFLLEGLSQGQDVLLVRLAESAGFTGNGAFMAECQDRASSATPVDAAILPHGRLNPVTDGPVFTGITRSLSVVDQAKVRFRVFEFVSSDRGPHPTLLELAMKPGALLPEEFIDILRLVYTWEREERSAGNFGIGRAALIQVGAIGISYPLLYRSTTAADLFLPSLVHILRCRGTAFLMTGQTGGVPQSEEMVKRAESVADCVIRCQHCDVFGDRYITVTGPGLIERDMDTGRTPETVPGVLRRRKGREAGRDYFEVDMRRLEGLVGFSTGHIRRPGISLQLFQEGTLHRDYNRQVTRLVEFAMGNSYPGNEIPFPLPTGAGETMLTDRLLSQLASRASATCIVDRDAPVVSVDTFDSVDSGSFHSSLGLLDEAPLHNTVLRTIDEYAVDEVVAQITAGASGDRGLTLDADQKASLLYGLVYYRNVLLVAGDSGSIDALTRAIPENASPSTKVTGFWRTVSSLLDSGVRFISDFRAPETLSCCLMDGILGLVGRTTSGRDGKGVGLPSLVQLLSADGRSKEDVRTYMAHLTACMRRAVPLLSEADSTALSVETADCLARKPNLGWSGSPRFLVLGWYSHIREMIRLWNSATGSDADRHREYVRALAQMRVLGLPGGGVKGDWYLHVPPGSISESLGRRVKETLLAPQEDFRRFAAGVGLPCWPEATGRFARPTYRLSAEEGRHWDAAEARHRALKQQADPIRHSPMAWPGSRTALEGVLTIHQRANRRSKMLGYQSIRSELSALMEHIRCADAPDDAALDELVNESVAYVLALLRGARE